MKGFYVAENDSEQRLDKFLTKACPGLPQSMLYKAIRLKKIKVNRKRCEISYRLKTGDHIEIYLNDNFFGQQKDNDFLNISPNLDIVYEDENILLINKKPGIIVHSDTNENYNTLIAHILSYLYRKGEYNPNEENSFVPALCNRLDRNTGGIIIAAKNAASLRILNEKIKNREINKYYLCVVLGCLKEKKGHIKNYITKNESQNRVYISEKREKDSKTAELLYRVIAEKDNLSLVEISLITGRTHQIRAQMADMGHPLLGDGKYGIEKENRKRGVKRQLLTSYKLTFDFKDDGGILSYLKGKEFTLNDIDFVQFF